MSGNTGARGCCSSKGCCRSSSNSQVPAQVEDKQTNSFSMIEEVDEYLTTSITSTASVDSTASGNNRDAASKTGSGNLPKRHGLTATEFLAASFESQPNGAACAKGTSNCCEVPTSSSSCCESSEKPQKPPKPPN